MTRNPIVDQASAMATALGALKLKRLHIHPVEDGVEIVQRGKPTLLLTYAAAEAFVRQIQETENG